MKTRYYLNILLLLLFTSSFARANDRKSIVVLNIDVKRMTISSTQLGQLARYELDKLDTFTVVDQYELLQLAGEQEIALNECYSKTCMNQVATLAGTHYALTGSAERLQNKIFFNLRLMDLSNPENVKSKTIEFLPLQNQIQTMTRIALMNILDLPLPNDVVEQLTKTGAINSGVNNPYYRNLNLSGPRMGVTYFTPELANNIHLNGLNDGQRTSPIMSQFGYQFETQYLSENNFQALFEFIPMISGLDQGLVIPSLTVLNGFRNSASGLEIAVGPAIAMTSKSEGYYLNNQWVPIDDNNPAPAGITPITRVDRHGDLDWNTYVVIAVGKTVTQGRLNIPFNVYGVPSTDGWRFGFSVGFNSKS